VVRERERATGQRLKKRAGALSQTTCNWRWGDQVSCIGKRWSVLALDQPAPARAAVLSPAAGWLLAARNPCLAAAFLASHMRLSSSISLRKVSVLHHVLQLASEECPQFPPQRLRSCTTRRSPRRVSRPSEICFVDSYSRFLSRPSWRKEHNTVAKEDQSLCSNSIQPIDCCRMAGQCFQER
jgi:hypothetical protein